MSSAASDTPTLHSTPSQPGARFSLARIASVFWRHRAYALALPLLSLFITLVHEGAHALAVIATGGRVLSLQLLPRWEDGVRTLGAIEHQGSWSPGLVSLAPSVAWTSVLLAGIWLVPRLRGAVLARLAVMALFLAPMRDLAMTAGGLFLGDPTSDLYTPWYGHRVPLSIAAAAYFGAFGLAGYRVLRRRFGTALTAREYSVLLALFLFETWIPQPGN